MHTLLFETAMNKNNRLTSRASRSL